MTNLFRKHALPAFVLATLAGTAFADEVTFGNSAIAIGSSPFATEGVTFSASSGGAHGVSNVAGFGASNGTYYLVYLAAGSRYEVFAMADSSAFTLSSMEIGPSQNFGALAQTLTISGYRGTDVVASDDVVVQPGTSFQSHSFDEDWTNLDSVRLGSLSRGYVAVDNIVLTPVPEPETYAMLLAGLGLIPLAARRRRGA